MQHLPLFAPTAAAGHRARTQALLTAAVAVALAAALPAQQQFAELRALPAGNGRPAFGDVNGDGWLDLVIATGGQNRLLFGDGRGGFTDVTAGRMPVDADNTLAVALGDIDGDGDLDIVFGNDGTGSPRTVGGQNRLYRNDGTGTFTDVTATHLPAQTDPTAAVVLGDIDGDGDLDLVCGNRDIEFPPSGSPWVGKYAPSAGTQNRLYRNDGTGRFTDVTTAQLPADTDATTGLVLGDVDGDGDLDLILASGAIHVSSRVYVCPPPVKYCYWAYTTTPVGQQDRLYRNDGTGRFTDVTATHLPPDTDRGNAVAMADLDGDGDLDIVIGNHQIQNRLYRNDGSGRFQDATATHMPSDTDPTTAVVLADLDGDGHIDLVSGNGTTNSVGQDRLYRNDGTGRLLDATTRLPAGNGDRRGMAAGDTDGDGDLDLVLGSASQVRHLSNLLRQFDTPLPPTRGQNYRFDVYARYGPPRLTDLALPFLSLGPASIPLPPFGTLGIDPATAAPLPWLVVPQPAGNGSVAIPVPNNPALVGLQVHAQALLMQDPVQTLLTNVVRGVVQ